MSSSEENKKLWFRAKCYGWGWTPVTWQGWIVTLAYIAVLLWPFYFIGNLEQMSGMTFFSYFVPIDGVATALMIWICYKTGEKPQWRWGKKDGELK